MMIFRFWDSCFEMMLASFSRFSSLAFFSASSRACSSWLISSEYCSSKLSRFADWLSRANLKRLTVFYVGQFGEFGLEFGLVIQILEDLGGETFDEVGVEEVGEHVLLHEIGDEIGV